MQGSAGGMMGMPGYGTAGGVPAAQQPTDHVNLMSMMQAKSVNMFHLKIIIIILRKIISSCIHISH